VKPRTSLVLLCALLTLGAPAAAGDERPRRLRFNPFAQPELAAIAQADPSRVATGAFHGWAPELTATLTAGEESLANLGGVILGIGEETHGYRLVKVDVFEASFEKDGGTLVLPIEPRNRREGR
jgi:hypothetical protein